MRSHGEAHGATIEQYGGTYEQQWGNHVENHETSMGILGTALENHMKWSWEISRTLYTHRSRICWHVLGI